MSFLFLKSLTKSSNTQTVVSSLKQVQTLVNKKSSESTSSISFLLTSELIYHSSSAIRLLISSIISDFFCQTAPNFPLNSLFDLSSAFLLFLTVFPILSQPAHFLFTGVSQLFDNLAQINSHFILCHLPNEIPEILESLSFSKVSSTSIFISNVLTFCQLSNEILNVFLNYFDQSQSFQISFSLLALLKQAEIFVFCVNFKSDLLHILIKKKDLPFSILMKVFLQ